MITDFPSELHRVLEQEELPSLQTALTAIRMSGSSINTTNSSGWTPLRILVERFDDRFASEACQVMLENGCDQTIPSRKGDIIPVQMAIKNGKIMTARILLEHSPASVHRVNHQTGMTCLHYAAQRGDVEMCREVCSFDPSLNARTTELLTPMHYAAQTSSPLCCKFLLERGCTMNVKTLDGNSPAHYAAAVHNLDVLNYCISEGCDPLERNRHGHSAVGKFLKRRIDELKRTQQLLRAAPDNHSRIKLICKCDDDEANDIKDMMHSERPCEWSLNAYLVYEVIQSINPH